ncbi:molybdenum cofactor biosynthesis protein [Desulfuribacillus stibiiarsenatis]|uniref:Molybdenum cofactor biosynthesis protein n=1 Tax=Desulfuribacillus stibiiarsenatis TaxID=1390249 RepID=A0A1E5L5H2_9FIRM|nr:MOSC domain-containing protein [Desulfuribacillus stibiiarsenatis]OEH85219.1 molybdenum cofactor biosynthesis protein [Desulfuribacillus stibiiarsenatis]
MEKGRIRAISISDRKGMRKTNVDQVEIRPDHGIVTDAHAGDWHRQLSLLAQESIEKMVAMGLTVKAGDFAENITTEGLDLLALPVGTRVRMGETIVEITQIGKECHTRCAIYYQAGDCVMPKEGIFAIVLKGGVLKVGDEVEELPTDYYRVGVLTASDKGSKGEREDQSGQVIRDMVAKIGGHVEQYAVVPDEKDVLRDTMKQWIDEEKLDLVLTTGGTGLGPRDVTPDAALEIIEKQIPGIAEVMRMRSLEKTDRAMLSRAVAGTRKQAIIVNLPGSPKAVEECLGEIIATLPHGIRILQGKTGECARK